jgi:hypothetical protein
MFARDSASPPSPIDMSRASIDTGDVPIVERIYAHEMTQKFEILLAMPTRIGASSETTTR